MATFQQALALAAQAQGETLNNIEKGMEQASASTGRGLGPQLPVASSRTGQRCSGFKLCRIFVRPTEEPCWQKRYLILPRGS